MRQAASVAFVVGTILAGCASPGMAEDYVWTIDGPKTVDKGAEFLFTVHTATPSGGKVEGVAYRYQIHWPGGPINPVRHGGTSGEPEKVKARMMPGTATLVVTCNNRQGLEVQVLETAFQVNGLTGRATKAGP